MTRKALLLGLCAAAILGNMALTAVAYGDLRQVCPNGAQCSDAWTNLLLFAGLAIAFVVAALMVWGGRIG